MGVRLQNALFEKQLEQAAATADKALTTIAKINDDLAAKLDRRRVERKASVRKRTRTRPYGAPASLADRIARATRAIATATADVPADVLTADTDDEDRDDNMGFGDLSDLSSSDEDESGTQQPPHNSTLAPASAKNLTGANERQLPRRPAPWSKRWKAHALESWRQKRTELYGMSELGAGSRPHGGPKALSHGDELLPPRRHRRVSG